MQPGSSNLFSMLRVKSEDDLEDIHDGDISFVLSDVLSLNVMAKEDNSPTNQLAVSRGLVNLRTSQLAEMFGL